MDNKSTTEKPDLVVICQVFYPELISTGQTLTEMVEELSRKGKRITVIAGQPTLIKGSQAVPARMTHEGITIIRTWSTRFPKTSLIGKLFNLTTFFLSASWTVLLKYPGIPLLLLTNPPYLPLLGWFCAVLRGQKYGVVLFDIMPEQAELLDVIRPNGGIAKIWRWFNRLWYQKAEYCIVLSRDMLEGALKNANLLGTPHEFKARAKTQVVHIWSDDRLITPLDKNLSQEARRLGVARRFVVQYSGNHGRFHDLETVIKVAATFSPEEGVLFQFIGEGQKKALVENHLRTAPAPHVYSSSYVAKELLGDSLAMADLGVVAQMPGQEKVCYPSKLLGILAAGRAVLAICPENCEMAQMIKRENLGFVIANGNVGRGREVLLHARDNPDLVKAMAENASRHLRNHFTLAKASAAYHQIIFGGKSGSA